MCGHFHTIVLRNVPEISLGERGATRFVKLIDTLYDNNVSWHVTSLGVVLSVVEVLLFVCPGTCNVMPQVSKPMCAV